MKAVDLFAGAGGASRGIHDAGYDVLGFEYWQPAVDTHLANGLPARLHDLSDPSGDALIPECDLMWASPPCQPFSAAGDGEGEFDERDGFPWTLRIVARLLPAVLIIENVKGLTFDKHADYFGGILQQLTRLGYDWDWKVLNSADYGVPQTRERCFIVCRRDGGPIVWPAVTHTPGDGLFTLPWVTMADALGWGTTGRPFSTVTAGVHGIPGGGCGGSGTRAALYAERDAGRWMLNYNRGEGMIERHGTRGPWPINDMPAPTVHANSAKDWLLDRRASEPSGVQLVDPKTSPAPCVTTVNSQWVWTRPATSSGLDQESEPGGAVEVERRQDQPEPWNAAALTSMQWPRQRPATTINGDPRVSAPGRHDPEVSGSQQAGAIRLTIAELAALQGFPADWVWTGSKTAQARQVGNAVPPIMAQLLTEANRPLRRQAAA